MFSEDSLCIVQADVHRPTLRERQVHALLMLRVPMQVAVRVVETIVRLRPVAVGVVGAEDVAAFEADHLGVPDVAAEDVAGLQRLVMVAQDEEDVGALDARPVAAGLREAEVTEDHEAVPSHHNLVEVLQDRFIVILDGPVLGTSMLSQVVAAEVQVCRKEGLP